MNKDIKKLIEKYQCPGCVSGSDIKCGRFEKSHNSNSCKSHCGGTMVAKPPLLFSMFLGLPVGFCRYSEGLHIEIFESLKEHNEFWDYDIFNVPVWKHYDGIATIIRGYSPRIDKSFLHIIKGDVRNGIKCIEITEKEMKGMD